MASLPLWELEVTPLVAWGEDSWAAGLPWLLVADNGQYCGHLEIMILEQFQLKMLGEGTFKKFAASQIE